MHPKLKTLFLSFSFILLISQAYSQSRHGVSVVFGFAGNDIIQNTMGGPSYQGKGRQEFGLRYTYKLSRSFALETGLIFSNDKIQSTSEFYPGVTRTVRTGNIKMMSIPMYVNFSFLKYVFVNGGLIADFVTNTPPEPITTAPAGVGLGLGIGGKYNFSNMTVFVNPNLAVHYVLYNGGGGMLGDAGIKFGFGYRF